MRLKNNHMNENSTTGAANKFVKLRILFVTGLAAFALLLLYDGVAFAQKSQTTDNKADGNLKSSARVNPSTLAMEFSLPLGSYPGRGGTSIPVVLNYSSKLWDMERFRIRTQRSDLPNNQHQVQISTDIHAIFSKKAVAGWTSSLQPPTIIDQEDLYNQDGNALDTSVVYSREQQNIADLFDLHNIIIDWEDWSCSVRETWSGADGSCVSGWSTHYSYVCTISGQVVYEVEMDGSPTCTFNPYPITPDPQPTPDIPPADNPIPEIVQRVKRVRVQMPDGSSHEFRKNDTIYNCVTSPNDCLESKDGTYLSVDGSRMKLVRGETQSPGNKKDVLYLPDGSRYIFPVLPSQGGGYVPAEKLIDGDGNFSTYDSGTQTWTDTMARPIKDPLPNPLINALPLPQTFALKGIDNQDMNYQIVWNSLGNVLEDTQTPHSLKYVGQDTCQDILMTPVTGNTLFTNQPGDPDTSSDGNSPNTSFIRNQRVCANNWGNPQLFSPLVMAEFVLPDGQKYKFEYNEYAEITKITYPTGGYERFEYEQIPPLGYTADEVYSQANRGVKTRYVSFDGAGVQQTWKYDQISGGIKITAPDQSWTERYLYDSTASSFGFENPLAGMPYEEWTYNTAGQPKSRTLTEWTFTPAQGTNAEELAKRDPRPLSTISIAFEKGNALATMTETDYDTPGANNSDLDYFARLNVKQVKSYHYLPIIDTEVAKHGNLTAIKNLFTNSGQLSAVSQTDYKYDPVYKVRGFPSLPQETRSLNPANPSIILAKTEFKYDEPAYETLDTNLSTAGWSNPTTLPECINNTANCKRGKVTTTRSWVSEANGGLQTNFWLETHAQFDTFGNPRKAWDASGDQNKFVETQFSSDYNYAYPTKVITPAPNGGTASDFGSTATSSAETTYDLTTGLPLTVTNDAGQITKTDYDAYSRPWRVYADNYVAPETRTEYGVPVNGQLLANQRFVKVKKQIDATNWAETTTWMDGLGRAVLSQTKDAGGDVFVETQYDVMGRAAMTTNPYRGGETKLWNLTEFDAAGRVKQTRAPVANQSILNPTGDILGTNEYDFSTTQLIGTVVTTTDASGRRSRSITNALGQLLRVDEPTGLGGATADADLGGLGSPYQPTSYTYDLYGKMVKVQQGNQYRYFKYDSLGRLIRVKQPEQDKNDSLSLSDSYNTSSEWTAGFTYDIFGNALTATDARGVTVTNTYDRANRVLTRMYSGEAAGQQTPNVYFTYDGVYYPPDNSAKLSATGYAKGALTQVRNGLSTSQTIAYDAFGRPLTYEQITDGQTYQSKYAYNFAGALETETYPGGRTVKNEFNADGDLLRISGKANQTAIEKTYANSFSYTADGKIAKLRLGNGLWEAAKFNSRRQITELGVGVGAENLDKWKVNYDYGELDTNGTNIIAAKNTGNIARQTVSFTGLTNPLVQNYRYDSLNRLVEAKEMSGTTQTWLQQYKYDRYGNRERTGSLKQVGAAVEAQNNLTFPTINPLTNRFEDGQNYTYDKNGNLTIDPTDGGRGFTFNGENKQTEVRDANNNLIGKYFYDGEGKRVKKQTYDANDQVKEVTVFVYSGGKLIQEYSTAPPPTNPTTNYVATDILQSVRAITNALGEITSRRDFMPFGEEVLPDGASRTTNQKYSLTGDKVRQRFTGYQKDEETSLDFAEARMYNNSHGRFTAVDPLLASGKSANPQTFNRFVYCLNNPLINTDPSGLQVGTASGKVYRTRVDGGWSYAIFSGKALEGYSRVNRTINTTTRVNGVDYTATVTPSGWTIGNRLDNKKIQTTNTEQKAAMKVGDERVQSLVKAVTEDPKFRAIEKITNPDGIGIGYQSPFGIARGSVTITKNYDFLTSYSFGLSPSDMAEANNNGNLTSLFSPRKMFGNLSFQATHIAEMDVGRDDRLQFFEGNSVSTVGCVYVCGGITRTIPNDGSPQRSGFVWGLSPGISAPDLSISHSDSQFNIYEEVGFPIPDHERSHR